MVLSLETQRKRIVVGLSGGVDSAVSAGLLLEAGFVVEGAFIIPWSPNWLPCTWREERQDALRVALQLGIPFHTIDLSQDYERDVAHYFIREYGAGRTPNPDVFCNKAIKFGSFFNWALTHGFDGVATGHYARTSLDNALSLQEDKGLFAGVDPQKDQSYFLWALPKERLARVLFPVGGMEKGVVREKARALGLSVAQKKDSQGVCFLGKLDMRDFLEHFYEKKEGAVLDEGGRVIGVHDGALFFTLGQRHGFSVQHTSPNTPPLFVVAKNMEHNTITVAPKTKEVSFVQEVTLSSCNWFKEYEKGKKYTARFRYRQSLFAIERIECIPEGVRVSFVHPQQYVSGGQSLVLYEGARVLGGGVLD